MQKEDRAASHQLRVASCPAVGAADVRHVDRLISSCCSSTPSDDALVYAYGHVSVVLLLLFRFGVRGEQDNCLSKGYASKIRLCSQPVSHGLGERGTMYGEVTPDVSLYIVLCSELSTWTRHKGAQCLDPRCLHTENRAGNRGLGPNGDLRTVVQT